MNREKLEKAAKGYSASRGGLNVKEIRNYLISTGFSEDEVKVRRPQLNELLKTQINSEIQENKETKTNFSFDEQIQLTGVDDIDIEILAQTPLDVIDRYCRRNQEVFDLCKKQRLWQKIAQQMGITTKKQRKSWRKTVEENRISVTDKIIKQALKNTKPTLTSESQKVIKEILERFASELSFVNSDRDSLLLFLQSYFKLTPKEEKELKQRKRTYATARKGSYQTIVDIEWDLADWISKKEKTNKGQIKKEDLLLYLTDRIIDYLRDIVNDERSVIAYQSTEEEYFNDLDDVPINKKELLLALSDHGEFGFFFPYSS